MWTYWFLFGLVAWLAMTHLRPEGSVASPTGRLPVWWRVVFVLLVLTIGLRHEVGGDWVMYSRMIESGSDIALLANAGGDPAYSLLNWLANRSGLGPYLVNTVCAVIFSWGLVVFCRAQPRPWLALVVAMPFLVTVVAMGYTRQSVAISLVMVGLVALSESKLLRFVVFVALAASFHKTAVIMMPLAAFAGKRFKISTVFWVGLSSVLFYILLLRDKVDLLIAGYILAEYSSQGAAVRVAMNTLPAVLFLCFRRRFIMLSVQRTLWTWISLGALGLLGLLQVLPSSTVVDRLSLYLIPLQLFVFSRLPDALGKRDGLNVILVLGVVVYSAAVLFVWMGFAVHAYHWLPYQFYPWVVLWN